jgi:hypothetical protein
MSTEIAAATKPSIARPNAPCMAKVPPVNLSQWDASIILIPVEGQFEQSYGPALQAPPA